MQNRNVGLVVAALAVVAAVALFVVLRDDDEGDTETTAQTTTQATTTTDEQTTTNEQTTTKEQTTTEKPEVATIVVKDGQPVGGVQELSFAQGEDIRFTVESDVDEEVHLHGYDVSMDVKAGGKVEFDVPATEPGVFEVELEHSVVPLAEITVE
jgi:hypothetical protein